LEEFKVGRLLVRVVKGDITGLCADVIVNAANSWLKHGGGVALAIVNKGGKIIQDQSDKYVARNGPLHTGGVAVTRAGKLKAKFVIHAVGPVYGESGMRRCWSPRFGTRLLKQRSWVPPRLLSQRFQQGFTVTLQTSVREYKSFRNSPKTLTL
jgi:hypothetical protein